MLEGRRLPLLGGPHVLDPGMWWSCVHCVEGFWYVLRGQLSKAAGDDIRSVLYRLLATANIHRLGYLWIGRNIDMHF